MPAPIIIKAGGTTIEDAAPRHALSATISMIHASTPVVLLHGGGKAVDRHLERLGIVSERREGIRVTPPDQLDEIVAVLAGRVNKAVVGTLCSLGTPAVGLCLGDGLAFNTTKTARYSFDPGRVGDVTGGEGRLLSYLLAGGFLPVVSSIGLDRDGGFLNVNADDAAAGVAQALKAKALVLLTDVPGILDGSKKLVPTIDARGIERMIASGEITGGMIVKARAAAATADVSGVPVVILSGSDPTALERWGSASQLNGDAGVGTRILPVSMTSIR